MFLRRKLLLGQQPSPPQSRFSFASAQGGSFQGFIFNMKKEEETLYQVLKVKSSCTQKEIKLGYYKLAKQYHPDFQHDQTESAKKESEVKFKQIQKAYEVLSNPISRQAYDIDN